MGKQEERGKFREYEPDQMLLFGSFDPARIVGEGEAVRLVDELVEHLDLSSFESRYSELGTKGYDPRLLVKVLLFGYMEGVFSSRKLMRLCRRDAAFMYLCRGQHPDFRTISDFRKVHREGFREVFKQIVGVARRLGMVKLGRVVMDSTKQRANASRDRTLRREEFETELAELDAYLEEVKQRDEEEDQRYGKEKSGEELPEGLETASSRREKIREALKKSGGKKWINETDPESQTLKNRRGGRSYPGYHCETMISEESVIIGNRVENEGKESDHFEGMVEMMEEELGEEPERIFADSGYHSGATLKECAERGIEAYIPDGKTARSLNTGEPVSEPGPYAKERFQYDVEQNVYICPEGKVLPWRSKHIERSGGRRRERHQYWNIEACAECPVRGACCKNQRFRNIRDNGVQVLHDEMRSRFEEEGERDLYRRTRKTVERVFGHIKGNLGFRQFRLRGKAGAQIELDLLCSATNVRRIGSQLGNSLIRALGVANQAFGTAGA